MDLADNFKTFSLSTQTQSITMKDRVTNTEVFFYEDKCTGN